MRRRLETLPREPADRFMRPLGRFLRIEAAASAVLLVCAIVALVASNSPWAAPYLAFWEHPVGFRWGESAFVRSLRDWINDGAMTFFFFVVALELKRELVLGELRSPRIAALPLAAAIGGMVVPALVYLAAVTGGGATKDGWSIVMATDTAFVIGCLGVLGGRIPRSLRLFLLSLAIFDDIGAILLIAFLYGTSIDPVAILCAIAALVGVVVLRQLGLRHVAVYTVVGVLAWVALDTAGLHPTLAGVALGLMTPTRSWVSGNRLSAILGKVVDRPVHGTWRGTRENRQDLRRAGVATREALSPLERVELALHPWVAFAVLPAFALANAGLAFSREDVDWALSGAVITGLVVGKPLGVISFSYAAVRLGLARRPAELEWQVLLGGALLTGIGFTMSLLIAELALSGELLASAKLGILLASLLSALLGIGVLIWRFVLGPRLVRGAAP